MGPLFLLIGLALFLLPLVFVPLAWKASQKKPQLLPEWRSNTFSWALAGSTFNCALSVFFFLAHNFLLPWITHHKFMSATIYPGERVVEWYGVLSSLTFFILAFLGVGKGRIFVALASLFTLYLWAGTL